MDAKDLGKLEEIRDDAARKMQQAASDAANFENWPHPVPQAILSLGKQLAETEACWLAVRDWAAQAIRSDIEKELM